MTKGWRLAAGAAAGVLGGLAGAQAMVRFNHLLGPMASNERGRHDRRREASPNEHDGTISDEPASMEAAARTVEAVTGRPAGESVRSIGGTVFHYAFGASVGLVYGLAAESRPAITTGAGTAYGALVWIAADETGVPLAGLADPPHRYPAGRHISSLGSHLAYGLVLEAVRRALRGRPRP